ncbi:MAG: hypothetical protein ACREGC_03665 [Minisyncoccia bacterium]
MATDYDDLKDIKSKVQNALNLFRAGRTEECLVEIDNSLHRLEGHKIAFPHRTGHADTLIKYGHEAKALVEGLIQTKAQQ